MKLIDDYDEEVSGNTENNKRLSNTSGNNEDEEEAMIDDLMLP